MQEGTQKLYIFLMAGRLLYTPSSLAASFDRIKIQYGNGKTVMISLQNRQDFYKEIQKRKSDIKII